MANKVADALGYYFGDHLENEGCGIGSTYASTVEMFGRAEEEFTMPGFHVFNEATNPFEFGMILDAALGRVTVDEPGSREDG